MTESNCIAVNAGESSIEDSIESFANLASVLSPSKTDGSSVLAIVEMSNGKSNTRGEVTGLYKCHACKTVSFRIKRVSFCFDNLKCGLRSDGGVGFLTVEPSRELSICTCPSASRTTISRVSLLNIILSME